MPEYKICIEVVYMNFVRHNVETEREGNPKLLSGLSVCVHKFLPQNGKEKSRINCQY